MREKIQRFIKAFQMNGPVRRRTLTICGIVVALILLIILLSALLHKKPEPEPEPDPVVEEPIVVEPVEVEPVEVELPDGAQEIFDKYPDVYGWLWFPGTGEGLGTGKDIDYPVAQHPTDRLFYLSHDLDGNNSKTGTLFTEAEVEGVTINSRDWNDPVTIIYGHNMANRTMFGGLQFYIRTLDYSKENVMYIYQPGRRITYQIVGGVQISTDHVLYYHDFSNPDVFNSYFETLWKDTDYYTNVDKNNRPVAGDRLLMLSVCKNGDDAHRYLVIGKVIEDTDEINAANLAAAQEAAQKAAEEAAKANQG